MYICPQEDLSITHKSTHKKTPPPLLPSIHTNQTPKAKTNKIKSLINKLKNKPTTKHYTASISLLSKQKKQKMRSHTISHPSPKTKKHKKKVSSFKKKKKKKKKPCGV